MAGGVTAAVARTQSPQGRSLTLEQWQAGLLGFTPFISAGVSGCSPENHGARSKGTDLGGTVIHMQDAGNCGRRAGSGDVDRGKD